MLNPGHVVIWGTLTRYACEGAVAEVNDGGPLQPLFGVPCAAEAAQARLLPDGGLIYRNPMEDAGIFGAIYAVVADPPERDGGRLQYPSNIIANDIVVAGCDDGGTPGRFFVRPGTGSVVCECEAGVWHEGFSGPVPTLAGTSLIALGYANTALATIGSTPVVILDGGAAVAVPFGGIPDPALTRAHPQGFLAVRAGTTTCELFLIKFDGSVLKVGDYTAGGGAFCAGRIDDEGTMYYAAVSVFQIQVVRRPLSPAPISFVYSETASTNWASGPTYRLVMIDGNGLVTGP